MSGFPASGLAATFVLTGILPDCKRGWRNDTNNSHHDLQYAKQDGNIPDVTNKKNPHAQALGRLGGVARGKSLTQAEIVRIAREGGKARAAKLSARERSRIARLGVQARERKRKEAGGNA
jgi:hypothetical protein